MLFSYFTQKVNVSKLLSAVQQERSSSILFLLTNNNRWVFSNKMFLMENFEMLNFFSNFELWVYKLQYIIPSRERSKVWQIKDIRNSGKMFSHLKSIIMMLKREEAEKLFAKTLELMKLLWDT